MATTEKLIKVIRGERKIRELTSVAGSSPATKVPHVWRGNGQNFKVGIFLDDDTPDDLSDLASVTIQYQDTRDSASTHVTKTISSGDITDTITKSTFEAGTAQHFTVEFDDADLNPDLSGEDSVTYWFVIFGLDTSGKERTLGAGAFLTIEEDGSGASPGSPSGGGTAITATEAAALIETNIGLRATVAVPASTKTAAISWGKTLASAPSYFLVTATMTNTGDTPQNARIVAGSATTTGATVSVDSDRHANAINVTVIAKV